MTDVIDNKQLIKEELEDARQLIQIERARIVDLLQELAQAKEEIARLKEFEWMYKELSK